MAKRSSHAERNVRTSHCRKAGVPNVGVEYRAVFGYGENKNGNAYTAAQSKTRAAPAAFTHLEDEKLDVHDEQEHPGEARDFQQARLLLPSEYQTSASRRGEAGTQIQTHTHHISIHTTAKKNWGGDAESTGGWLGGLNKNHASTKR